MKKAILLTIGFVLFLTIQSCGGGSAGSDGDGDGAGGDYTWTYMVYVGGDNNLSEAAFTDIGEMESVGSSSDVAIVVQAEFSTEYSDTNLDSTYRCFVSGDDGCIDMSDGTDIGDTDMGSSAALQAFIEWAMENYSADNYALVIWDHGAGWKDQPIRTLKRGAVSDETSGSFMSLPGLANAVEAAEATAGDTIDLINFDACLMAMYEVAYEFNGLTDYLVFSEETEPGDGDPYDTILDALKDAPSTTPAELAASIVEKYSAFYEGGEATTKSAVDMAQLGALDTAVLALAAALDADAGSDAVIDDAANGGTLEYTYPDNHDLYRLAEYLDENMTGDVKTAAGSVMTAVDSFVIASATTDASMEDSKGVAIYLPLDSEASDSNLTDYAALACNASRATFGDGTWGDFVNTYLGGTGGLTEATGSFSVKLTWTNTSGGACDADVDLYLFEPYGGDYYSTAPWQGTAINGTFSDDSHINCYDENWDFIPGCTDYTAEEIFEASDSVTSGDYYFLANFVGNGTGCTQATAHYFYKESGGSYAEVGLGTTIDDSAPYSSGCSTATADGYANCLDAYSDWWLMDTVSKSFIKVSGDQLRSFGKIIKTKK